MVDLRKFKEDVSRAELHKRIASFSYTLDIPALENSSACPIAQRA